MKYRMRVRNQPVLYLKKNAESIPTWFWIFKLTHIIFLRACSFAWCITIKPVIVSTTSTVNKWFAFSLSSVKEILSYRLLTFTRISFFHANILCKNWQISIIRVLKWWLLFNLHVVFSITLTIQYMHSLHSMNNSIIISHC